jgi:hypothetical protein
MVRDFYVSFKLCFISGLTNKKIGRLEDALDAFYKLHAILRNSPQVIFQIADMYPCIVYNIII